LDFPPPPGGSPESTSSPKINQFNQRDQFNQFNQFNQFVNLINSPKWITSANPTQTPSFRYPHRRRHRCQQYLKCQLECHLHYQHLSY
jgi:hypothetical protein